jgi:hypothetical protein
MRLSISIANLRAKIRSRAFSNAGFSLVETVVAVGISGVIVLGASQLFLDVSKEGSKSDVNFWLNARRAEIQNNIRNEIPWAAIVAANPALACLATTTGCAAYKDPLDSQRLKLPMDGTLLDGGLAGQGMTRQGDLCSTFDETNGNANCPIGIKVHWQAMCESPICVRAQPKIDVSFVEKNPKEPLKALKSFHLTVFRDPKAQSVNAACEAMGGTLVANVCTLPVLADQCDPASGNFLLGFYPDGKVICGKPPINSCAASEVAVGFTAAGGIACSPACH